MTSQAITGACLEIQCTSHAILGACHFIQSANHGIPAKQCVPLPFQFIKYACKIIRCTFQAISLNFQATCTLCNPKSSHESPIPFRAPSCHKIIPVISQFIPARSIQIPFKLSQITHLISDFFQAIPDTPQAISEAFQAISNAFQAI